MTICWTFFFAYLVRGFVTDFLGTQVECSPDYPNCYSCTISDPPNLILNGEFEANPISERSMVVSHLDYWSRESMHYDVHTVNFDPVYDDGFQFIDLDQDTNLDAYQCIKTVPTMQFNLSLWYSGKHRYSFDPPETTDAEVLINDEVVGVTSRPADEAWVWKQYFYLFEGTGKTKIAVRGTGPQDNRGANIDGIRVQLSNNQPAYLVTYDFTPNSECTLCQTPSQVGEACSSSASQVDCYAYYINGGLVPVNCWHKTSETGKC